MNDDKHHDNASCNDLTGTDHSYSWSGTDFLDFFGGGSSAGSSGAPPKGSAQTILNPAPTTADPEDG